MDFDMDMDIDEIWSSALQNFEDCIAEKQTPAQLLTSSPLLDEDIDIDSIWQTAMDNFEQCTSRDNGIPDVQSSKTSSSSDLEAQGPMHTSLSPSSSSFVPSPQRRRKQKKHNTSKKEASKAVSEDGVNDEEVDGPWENHQNLAIKLANPSQWMTVIEALPTLKPGIKLDGCYMEFYMLWFTMQQLSSNKMWYVHMQTAMDCILGVKIDQEVIDDYRLSMNITIPAAQKPIVMICPHADHFFVVVLDYSTSSFYILGRNIAINLGRSLGDASDLRGWNGLNIWSQMPLLFGWDEDLGSSEPSVIQIVNWRQNGIDCGAYAVPLACSVLRSGIHLDRSGLILKPALECPHYSRLRILRGTLKFVGRSYNMWESCRDDFTWVRDAENDAIDLCSDANRLQQSFAHVESAIAMERDKCSVCVQASRKEKERREKEDAAQPSSDPPTDEQHKSVVKVAKHLMGLPDMRGARNRHLMKPRIPTRLPHAMDLPLQRFQFAKQNRCVDYDDYFLGPVLDDLYDLQRAGGLEGFPVDLNFRPTVRSAWERFKDYGYRLQREFAWTWNRQVPLYVKEHTLQPAPIGTHDNLTEGEGNDSIVMGMSEMLEDAGDPGSIASMEMFVAGRTVSGNLIIIDPLRDSVPIQPESLHLSADIDSFIWITDYIRTCSEVGIHVLPYSGKRPPIYKTNHACVELLNPQSQADQDQGGRQEWFSTRHSLSTIPHTHFACLSVGNVTINISVFFPRMKHRDPLTGKRATLIPWEIQTVWLTEVVYPALLRGEDPSTMPYKDYTLDQWRWKTQGAVKTVPISEHNLSLMQHRMLEIIQEDDSEDLHRFASFFFVMDGRAMKESTMVDVATEENPFTMLCKRYPQLHWDHMMKRENGQLLLDIGLAYNMDGSDGPLVALWDLPKLRYSYAACGMKAPTIHHTNTLAHYGGMQAEMPLDRQRITQLCFRLSYGLYYQPVRSGRGGDINFCNDSNAYQTNSDFRKSIRGHIRMLHGSKDKSFGVREEIRGSGPAIKEILTDVQGLMARYLKSKPFICIKSSVFFEFQARRMEELFNVQMHMSRCAPANYGTMTALFMHLIRHVNHCPIPMAPYLRDTLYDLLFDQNIERFGMFFISDLDLDNGDINGIMAEDSLQCRKDMTGSIRPNQSRPRRNILTFNTEPSAQFPIGHAPSWADIKHVLHHEPMKLLHTWIWNNDWDSNDVAGQLFIHFTRQFWMTIQEDCFLPTVRTDHSQPDPDTLEEAMSTWTVPSLLSTLNRITCLPSNHGLAGNFPGKRHRAFRDWVPIFFPSPDNPQHKFSVWKELYVRGYIKEFHDHLLEMSPAEAMHLQDRLGDIFERLQCIPFATPSTPTNLGQLWKTEDESILFYANPRHYKLERVAPKSRAGTSVFRVKASRDMINARLDKELDGIDIGDGKRARRRLRNAQHRHIARRSVKQRNNRVPPTRNKQNETQADTIHSPAKRATRRIVLSPDCGDELTPSPRSSSPDLPGWNVLSEQSDSSGEDEDAESNQMDEDQLMMTDYGEDDNDFTIGEGDPMDLD